MRYGQVATAPTKDKAVSLKRLGRGLNQRKAVGLNQASNKGRAVSQKWLGREQ